VGVGDLPARPRREKRLRPTPRGAMASILNTIETQEHTAS
jgi:hypothetical protein